MRTYLNCILNEIFLWVLVILGKSNTVEATYGSFLAKGLKVLSPLFIYHHIYLFFPSKGLLTGLAQTTYKWKNIVEFNVDMCSKLFSRYTLVSEGLKCKHMCSLSFGRQTSLSEVFTLPPMIRNSLLWNWAERHQYGLLKVKVIVQCCNILPEGSMFIPLAWFKVFVSTLDYQRIDLKPTFLREGTAWRFGHFLGLWQNLESIRLHSLTKNWVKIN